MKRVVLRAKKMKCVCACICVRAVRSVKVNRLIFLQLFAVVSTLDSLCLSHANQCHK